MTMDCGLTLYQQSAGFELREPEKHLEGHREKERDQTQMLLRAATKEEIRHLECQPKNRLVKRKTKRDTKKYVDDRVSQVRRK